MKKILFLSFRNNPYGLGGGITTIIEYVSILNNNVNIEIMTPFKIKPLKNMQHIFLKNEKNWEDSKIILYLIHAIKMFCKIQDRFEKIIVFIPNPSLSFIGDIFNLFASGKVIVYFEGIIRDEMVDYSKNININNKIRLLFNNKYLARFSLKKCLYAVSSEYQKKQLILIGYKPSNINVIPNLPKTEPYYHNRLTIVKKKKVLLYIGHLNYEKNLNLNKYPLF